MTVAAETQTETDNDFKRWVTFKLENEKYCVNVMQVQEVLRMTDIAPVPGAPDYVIGIINLRGNVVTITNIRKRFGLGDREVDDSTRIIIVEIKNSVIGIQVDSVADVVDLKVDEIESAPNVGNEESHKYIQGVASRGGELLILIDLDKFLSDQELGNVVSG